MIFGQKGKMEETEEMKVVIGGNVVEKGSATPKT